MFIHISSLEKCLFNSFAHFLIKFFLLLLLSCRSSLYILDINPLSDIWFANIFSYSIGCLFTLLFISFDAQKSSFLMITITMLYIFHPLTFNLFAFLSILTICLLIECLDHLHLMWFWIRVGLNLSFCCLFFLSSLYFIPFFSIFTFFWIEYFLWFYLLCWLISYNSALLLSFYFGVYNIYL